MNAYKLMERGHICYDGTVIRFKFSIVSVTTGDFGMRSVVKWAREIPTVGDTFTRWVPPGEETARWQRQIHTGEYHDIHEFDALTMHLEECFVQDFLAGKFPGGQPSGLVVHYSTNSARHRHFFADNFPQAVELYAGYKQNGDCNHGWTTLAGRTVRL